MTQHRLCIHSHFYQPPRGDPFQDDEIGPEPEAAPYDNFVAKVAAECYTPNAELGNFEQLSFTVGATLGRWLERHAPETLGRVTAAEQAHFERWAASNAVAQPAHHTILPLNPARDKSLQVRWGLMYYEHRYSRPAEGMWLPEMAVDLETLQVLHDNGLKYTLLSQGQVEGAQNGAGPYWVRLPSGDRLAVFIRDDWHSNQLAFAVHTLGGAGRWARNTLSPLRRDYGRLLLLALDGEVFGYHHLGEEHFLHWLLTYEAGAVGYEVTTLGRDLREFPPEQEVTVKEYSAWNCPHGLSRWTVGCDCTPGDTRWKGALRRAFDNLAHRLDDAYAAYLQNLGADPWAARESYFRVRLGQWTEAQFLKEAGLGRLAGAQAGAVLDLALAQFHRQRMYVSPTFFYDDLDRAEPRYAIANGVRAALLEAGAAGGEYLADFRRDLAQAQSGAGGRNGAQIMDDILAQAAVRK